MRNNLPARFVRRLGSGLPTSPSHGPSFSGSLFTQSSESQRALLSHFQESYELLPEIPLKQSMFNKGTLRITKPGKYVLLENIIYKPETQFPTPDQFSHYPIGKNGPYHLGFFGREGDDVIIEIITAPTGSGYRDPARIPAAADRRSWWRRWSGTS